MQLFNLAATIIVGAVLLKYLYDGYVKHVTITEQEHRWWLYLKWLREVKGVDG